LIIAFILAYLLNVFHGEEKYLVFFRPWILRAVIRWLNISVCLGIELFSSSVGFQRYVADVGGVGHQTVKVLRRLSKQSSFCYWDAVREGWVLSMLGTFLRDIFHHRHGNSIFYSLIFIKCNFVCGYVSNYVA
jgi:xanthine/uracil/vitamin C permease (AzgA family)